MRCQTCDGELQQSFRFCPWCAAAQRTKLVEYFRGHPLLEEEPVGLRVSRYVENGRHVRVSIWNGEEAVAAIALEEREARRLGSFLAARDPAPSRRGTVRSRVEALAGRIR